MQRILVTGGAGFIGSHLVCRLLARGCQVHVLHRPDGNLQRLPEPGATLRLWPCDLRDAAAMRKVLQSVRPEAIYHLGGDSSVRHIDPALTTVLESVERNVTPTLNLVVAAATAALPGLSLVVRLGGLEEYGNGPLPYTESQREQPVSPYSASQVAVTHYLQMLAPRLGFRAVTIRPALVYGPGQSQQFLIPALMTHCLEGRDFPLRSGTQGRDLIYIDDLIDALERLLHVPVPTGEIINISTGREHLMRDVAAMIVRLSGAKIRLLTDRSAPPGLVEHLYASPEKARRLLGWKPSTDLAEGLRRTLAAFRAPVSAGNTPSGRSQTV